MLESPSHLNLWKQRFGRVPDYVWEQTGLETLVLAENPGHNKLARVPERIADLDGLGDFLFLHDNRLTSLPPSLARLTKSRFLNISESVFGAFPVYV
jgi:hypothetical protein